MGSERNVLGLKVGYPLIMMQELIILVWLYPMIEESRAEVANLFLEVEYLMRTNIKKVGH